MNSDSGQARVIMANASVDGQLLGIVNDKVSLEKSRVVDS